LNLSPAALCREFVGAAYLETPDFDGPRQFLTQLAAAEITGEHARTPSVMPVARQTTGRVRQRAPRALCCLG
jgi:hypothetical protein